MVGVVCQARSLQPCQELKNARTSSPQFPKLSSSKYDTIEIHETNYHLHLSPIDNEIYTNEGTAIKEFRAVL